MGMQAATCCNLLAAESHLQQATQQLYDSSIGGTPKRSVNAGVHRVFEVALLGFMTADGHVLSRLRWLQLDVDSSLLLCLLLLSVSSSLSVFSSSLSLDLHASLL